MARLHSRKSMRCCRQSQIRFASHASPEPNSHNATCSAALRFFCRGSRAFALCRVVCPLKLSVRSAAAGFDPRDPCDTHADSVAARRGFVRIVVFALSLDRRFDLQRIADVENTSTLFTLCASAMIWPHRNRIAATVGRQLDRFGRCGLTGSAGLGALSSAESMLNRWWQRSRAWLARSTRQDGPCNLADAPLYGQYSA
jgi:hypothetical protein